MKLRKLTVGKETIFGDLGKASAQPITRAGTGGRGNPYAGEFIEDLSPFFELGDELGAMVTSDLVAMLPSPAVSYGKAALVGVNGEMEHAAAITPLVQAPAVYNRAIRTFRRVRSAADRRA